VAACVGSFTNNLLKKSKQMKRKKNIIKTTIFLTITFFLLDLMAYGQVIVYPNSGAGQLELAAKEIRRYVYLRTDQLLDVQPESALPDKGDVILVANDQHPMVRQLQSEIGDKVPQGGYLIKTVNMSNRCVLVISGTDTISTLYGAYRFAEKLGVRFFLHGDTIPDTKIKWSLTGFNEKSQPISGISIRGVLPFHNFPEGPDWWNLGDYKAYISQLPKMGMNFIGFHLYPLQPGEDSPVPENGPEPSVWIGLPKDVNPDGTVKFAYPAYYAHTNHEYIFEKIKTKQFHMGSHLLFEKNDFGPDVMDDNPDQADPVELFNRVGRLWNQAFTHARNLGVKTCLGNEAMNGQTFAQGVPPALLEHLGLPPFGRRHRDIPRDINKELYKGIFTRIKRTHPLDYYCVWTHELWYRQCDRSDVQAVRNEMQDAYAALNELQVEFQMCINGWQQGRRGAPDLFDDILPDHVPFGALWGEGYDYGSNLSNLKDARPKWAFTWMEEDWGLVQPQTEVNRVYNDLRGAIRTTNCQGFITKFWRTRILAPNFGAMRDLLWVRGPIGQPLNHKLPSSRNDFIDAYYLDWATQSFGPEVAKEIAYIFARMDKSGERGRYSVPRALDWELAAPGAITQSEESWNDIKSRYAFIDELAALRSRIIGAGNLERFDYFLKAYQSLKLIGELGVRFREYEEMLDEEKFDRAYNKRLEIKSLWEPLLTLQVEKASNSSDLGEIKNLEELNYNRLIRMMDDELPNKEDINPGRDYLGKSRMVVTPLRTQVDKDEALTCRVTIMAQGLQHPVKGTLLYRRLGKGTYQTIPLTHVNRAVYIATIPPQKHDYEYYITSESSSFPVTAPDINQTVIVGPSEGN
jgi:hypothetical protein